MANENVEQIDPAALNTLTPEQVSAFKQSFSPDTQIQPAAPPAQPKSEDAPPTIDPASLAQLNPEQLADFATKTKWSPYTYAQQNPDKLDDATFDKLAQTDLALRKRGFKFQDIDWGSVATAPVQLAKGLASYLGKGLTGAISPIVEATGALPPGEAMKVGAKETGEMLAGTEAAATGFWDTIRRGFNKTGRLLHLQKPLDQYTPEDAQKLFRDELSIRNQMAEVGKGKGELLQTFGGEALKDVQLNPEEISKAAAGDPFTFRAFSGGFNIVNGVTGRVVGTAVSRAGALQTVAKLNALRGTMSTAETLAKDIPSAENLSAANQAALDYYSTRAAAGAVPRTLEAAQQLVNKVPSTSQAIGVAARAAGGATQAVSPVAGVGVAAHGLLAGHPGEVLALLGGHGGRGAIGEVLETAGKGISKFGTEMQEGAPGGTWTRAIQDATNVPQNIGKGMLKGLPIDLTLAALTSETPEETRETPLMGTAFGGLRGAVAGARGFVQGQLTAPRKWAPSSEWSRSYGSFPELDKAHQDTMRIASAGVKDRLGALRELAGSTGAQIYQMQGTEDFSRALQSLGYSPDDAANFANANGVALGEVPDAQGTPRRVILLRDPSSAPHEVGHPLESLFTQDQQNLLYHQIEKSYGTQGVMQRAYREAQALATTPQAQQEFQQNWMDFLLRSSGFGREAGLDPATATPEQKADLVKRYASKEIAADTIGTIVNHASPKMLSDNTFLGTMARVLAKSMVLTGLDPFYGVQAVSPFKTPIKQPVFEAARGMVEPIAKGAGPAPTVGPVAPGPRPVPGIPSTPEAVQTAADNARQIAKEAPDAPAVAGGRSAREILGQIAEAIAGRTGIKINYLSAPDEPAAATTSNRTTRRAIIEAYRTMPAASRSLWEKSFFPEQVVKTKAGKYQIQGWAPEVFAANAHKLAGTIAQIAEVAPGSEALSPYPIDVKAGTFTEEGWKQLFQDAQKFVANQAKGQTGAGEPLVVPKELTERGFYAPKTAGGAEPLDQRRADVINTLFNFKLPETPRMQKGKLPLNIAGQEVSQATLPGRVEMPVRPRGEFTGAEAEAQGIAGRQVLEVNPFRNELEAAAKAAGIPAPSFIEAIQKLNLENIKEVQGAPELPQFRGNTLTLTAGFQPSNHPDAVKVGAVVRDDETGKRYRGQTHYEASQKWREEKHPNESPDIPASWLPGGGPTQGFESNSGEFLDRIQAAKRAEEHGQVPPGYFDNRISGLESTMFEHYNTQFVPDITPPPGEGRAEAIARGIPLETAAQPRPQVADIERMNPDEFVAFTRAYPGGLTGVAHDMGRFATSPEEVQSFKDAQARAHDQSMAAMRSKNYGEAAMPVMKGQLFREAVEAAEGTGGSADFLKEKYPDYKPPFPKTPEVQAQPTEDRQKITEEAVQHYGLTDDLSEAGYILPDGRMLDLSGKNQGGTPGVRSIEHRTVAMLPSIDQPGDLSAAMTQFLNSTGAARIHYNGGPAKGEGELYIHTGGEVAPGLFRELGKIFRGYGIFRAYVDIENPTGQIIKGGNIINPTEGKLRKFYQTPPEAQAQPSDLRASFVQPQPRERPVEETGPKTYLIRHGSTAFNNENDPTKDKIRGHMDIPLNEKGKQEAAETAEKLAGSGIKKIYASDLDRTMETAAKIQEKTGAGVVPTPGLRPWNFGPTIEGHPTSEVQGKIDKLIANPDTRPEGGESFNEFKDRFLNTYHQIQDSHKDENTAIVTHYRGTKLLNAWRATGVDNDGVDMGVFSEKQDVPPASFEVLDKQGNLMTQAMPRPQDEPDAIKKAAVRAEDGSVFTGDNHFRATQKYYRSGNNEPPEEGFVTNAGEFLNRKQALKRAKEMGQEPRVTMGELHTGDIADTMLGGQAMPRARKEDEAKLLPGGPDLISKTWIYPGGKIHQLGGMWHHQALAEDPVGIAEAKKHGVKVNPFEGTDDDETRESALKKGFVRVNYDGERGLMTVESTATAWPKQREALERIVEANLPKIDKLRVNLLNDAVNDITNTETANLMNLANNRQKLAAIPFMGEIPKAVKATQAPTFRAPEEAAETLPSAYPGVPKFAVYDREGNFSHFAPDYDQMKEDAARIGGSTKVVRTTTGQAQPSNKFDKSVFEEELKKVRSGESGGQTFNPDGTRWLPPVEKSDLVTLASVNVDPKDLTREKVLEALGPYTDLLDDPGVVAGIFSFSKGGKPTVSIDLNAVVPQKYRNNTLAFAKANDQVSIWDAAKQEEVRSGGKGETKLKSIGEISDALELLAEGRPVDVEDIIKQNRAAEPVPQEADLFGAKTPLSTRQLSQMTKAQLAAHYPEAVVPVRRNAPVSSEITSSPLYKAAGSEEAAVNAFARKLVEFAKEYQDNPAYKAGSEWYSKFTPMLKKTFGKDAPVMAELLAATSPQNAPESNYAYAVDALEGIKSGRFNKLRDKYLEGVKMLDSGSWRKWYDKELKAGRIADPPAIPTEASFLGHWIAKNKLEPLQSNGKKYGISSIPVLQVIARRWLGGSGLKTQNFVQNLLGKGHEATIDLWADRTMRRLGYAGFKDRWRILPKNATGVSDADFLFSQKAFRAAAEKLGIEPDALQGALWFAEKQLHSDMGWGRLDLGDYRKEVPKTEMLRAGVRERLRRSQAEQQGEGAETAELVAPRKLNE